MGVDVGLGLTDHTENGRCRHRVHLRTLDVCLDLLERLQERGEAVVPHGVAARLRAHVNGIHPGMAIPRAMQIVLQAQEPHLAPGRERVAGRVCSRPDNVVELAAPASPPPRDAPGALTEREARALTSRIRMAADHRCRLLLDAHERKAWLALGYATWEAYVRRELSLSRSRSYELLDHARVMAAIEAAAGVSGIPDISVFAAGQIKPHLGEVIAAVRIRTAGVPAERVPGVVAAVIRAQRSHVNARRAGRHSHRLVVAPAAVRPNVTGLTAALDLLARMPPVDETIAEIRRADPGWRGEVDVALQWLTAFARSMGRGANAEAAPRSGLTAVGGASPPRRTPPRRPAARADQSLRPSG